VEIELYEILKPKVGEKEAKALVEYIETKVDRKLEDKKDILATKEDLANVKAELTKDILAIKEDLANVKKDILAIKEDLANVKKDILATKEDLANVRVELTNVKAELMVKIEKTNSNIIKWMFIFWAGQIGALIAILQIFFGK
jgi:predicted  nucleic acid-binding Zn-ribbon protein